MKRQGYRWIGLSVVALLLVALGLSGCRRTFVEPQSEVIHAGDTSELGNAMANEYEGAIGAARLLIAVPSSDETLLARLQNLRAETERELFEYGDQVSELTRPERLRVADVYRGRLEEYGSEWLERTIDHYMDTNPQIGAVLQSYVPLANYWNHEWLSENRPDAMRRLASTS